MAMVIIYWSCIFHYICYRLIFKLSRILIWEKIVNKILIGTFMQHELLDTMHTRVFLATNNYKSCKE